MVISLGGVAARTSLTIAGNAMDEAIVKMFRQRHHVLIGDRTAEQLKIELGSAMPVSAEATAEVKGRHAVKGLPCTLTVTGADIQTAIEKPVSQIVQAVRETLERTPPELSADIGERGVVLNGGGSLLKDFDRRITRDTGLPACWTADPLGSVVLGAGRMFADLDFLRRLSSERRAA